MSSDHDDDRERHDPVGLDLARSVARALGRTPRAKTGSSQARRRRRRTVDPQASGAAPDDRDPQPLDSTIERLVAERGWSGDVAMHGVFSRWSAIVGPELAEHCWPERFADGVATVRAASTAWATQVRLLAPTVVRRLNEELGDDTVQRVHVVGPVGPSWSKGPRAVRDGRGPRDTYG
ncbi:MAG: DUF721 domain-containing protein [Propionibacteriales bacterium]|nr:DUF721 domain-containing protein [Propionibacteriales bacterium]